MAKISENVIEEIKRRISIVDVVSRYLSLTSKGERYWGLCPFHDEKTPSFTVLPEKGFYHCFGCQKSGSIFDFVMEMESLTFVEAVSKLAQEAGIPLEKESPQQKKIRDERDALLDLYDKLAQSFNYILLNSKASAHAREYLYSRRFEREAIETFNLGYAPNDPTWLYNFLREKQYSASLLDKSGLFARRNKTYPLFRDRLIFPIRDWQGRVVAFGGRDLSGSSQAKYINTPETELYRKREIVYGLYEGLKEIKEEKSVILCEGYFDVMAMHQSGVKHAIAPLGTAFTAEQGKLVRRYAQKLYTLFDSDDAGRAATKKSVIIGEQIGLETFVITLDKANDPAELFETEGPQALKKGTSESKSAFFYLVHSAINMYDSLKATGKLQIFNEVKPYLDAISSAIVRQSYLRELAGYLQLDEQTLLRDYVEKADPKGEVDERSGSRPFENQKGWKQSTDLYAMLTLMNNRSLFSKMRTTLRLEYLIDERAVELYTVLEDSSREGILESDELILNKIGNSTLKEMVALSFQTEEFTKFPEQVLEETINRIKLRELEKTRKRVEHLIRIGEMEHNFTTELAHLLLEKTSLDEEISQLKEGK